MIKKYKIILGNKLNEINYKKHYLLSFFIIIYLLISFFTYKDFGITADEELEYQLGKNLVSFYTDKKEFFNNDTFINKPYLLSYYHFYPMLLNLINFSGYYEWYHLLNMMFSILIFIFGYVLFYKIYKNSFSAFLFIALLATTPRFIGHIPANPKDIPFAVMYFISFVLIYLKSNKSTKILNIIIGIVLGFTIGLRIIGYGLFVVYLFIQFINNKKITLEDFKNLTLIAIISHILLYLTWPYLFDSPLNIIKVLTNASNFEAWNREILFIGEFISKDARPIFYLPLYIFITTPLFILFTHLISIKYLSKDKLLVSIFFTIYLNLFLYLVVNPTVYNALRHFLFLIPFIVATSSILLIKVLNSKNKNKVIVTKVIILIHILFLINQIYKIHPYQYTYFNSLAKQHFDVKSMFEVDYWGASYKEGVEKLNNYIDKNNIQNSLVYSCNVDFAVRYYSKAKFDITNKRDKANFILCDYQNFIKQNYDVEIIDYVSRDNIEYLIIAKNKKT